METTSGSADDLRSGWSPVLTRVRLKAAHHVVTRHGHAAAVLVPAAWHAHAGGAVTDTITAETAVRGLSDLLDRAQGGEHVAVTHRGRAAAVAVPPEWHAQITSAAPDDRADSTAQPVTDPTRPRQSGA
ncbi:type II toxin-antitoxin system Phd/YefM family antitoxin [Streptomyces californicus]|uniref:type II toxin-antitoxin system Phd/YefM family antitoxin n=1 Tax=Streptomyces californicus TaxID=67351 RepID=UPI0037AF1188